LASAEALLTSLAPLLRALLAQNTLCVPLGRLALVQPDPARAHVLYAEPGLQSTDGRHLRVVCGACCFCFFMVRSRKLVLLLTTDRSRCVPPSHHIIPRLPTKRLFHCFFFSLRGPTCTVVHCTLLNVSHCRTPPGGQCRRGIPFSFAAFPQTSDNGSNDFGIWAADELQI
jgi:hypothetical protein